MKGLLSPSPWPSATAVSAPVLITASDTICVPSLIPPVISVTIPLEIPMLTGCAVNVSPSRVQTLCSPSQSLTTAFDPTSGTAGDLKDVELAEGLTTIGESAFRNLDQIEKLVIPGTVTTIGICAFYDCDGLQEIAIPDSVTSIGKAAFAYCGNVTDIQLPDQLEMIEEQAFMGCSKVSSLRIPDSVKTIKDEAFRYIYITELPYMQNVTTIGTRAFSISNLRSLEYPKCLTDFTATSLDGGGNAKIKYITFEDGCALNTLPEGLFSTYKENNTNLKEQREIKLPSFKERGSLISRCSFRFVLFSLYVENKPSGKVFKAHPSSNVMYLIFAFPPPSNEVAVKSVKHFGYSRLRRLLMLNARVPMVVTFCIYGSSVIYI